VRALVRKFDALQVFNQVQKAYEDKMILQRTAISQEISTMVDKVKGPITISGIQ
jgi:hypothetical protein